MPASVRVLLLADTHLGFDDPLRPRVVRRRRGPDFFACTEAALAPALRGEVDVVVHAGDLLYRSRVPASLVDRALAPLRAVADAGVPVVLVPGNHERSKIPFPLLARHPRIHVFHEPGTFQIDVRGLRVALSGFPFARDVSPPAFRDHLHATAWHAAPADVRLLCLHQAVEGARVKGYTFRTGRDVVAAGSLRGPFAAVLAGHIHRSQVLTHDRAGRPLSAPVLYPGSVERTSFAEQDETKGCLHVELRPGRNGGRLSRWTFRALPARPMYTVDVHTQGLPRERLAAHVRSLLAALPADAVVRLRPRAPLVPGAEPVLGAAELRRLAPSSMNVDAARPRVEGEVLRAAR